MLELPQPRYPNAHGCPECRDVCYGHGTSDLRWQNTLADVGALFDPSGVMKPWTKWFRYCVKCHAIWAVSFNPKDITYEQAPAPPRMKAALAPDATLDDLMEPLFAWAPVDEMTEHGLWEIDCAPQDLFDRLVAAWRHPKVDVARQSDILRQLTRLLSANNAIHAQRRKTIGWLIEDFRGFEEELAALERMMPDPRGPWAPIRRYSEEYLAHLQKLRLRPDVLRGPEPPPLRAPVPRGRPAKHVPQPPPSAVSFVPLAEAEDANEMGVAVGMRARTWQLLRHPLGFVPGAWFAWLFVERMGSQVDANNRPPVMGFFFAMALVFPGVAVARNAGVTAVPLWLGVWRRLSVVADYCMVALLVFGLVFAAAAVATAAGLQARLAEPDIAVSLISLIASVVLIRLWPFMIVPYLQPIEEDVPHPQSTGFWKRSAVSTAWKFTRTAGTFRRKTLPWFLAAIAAVGLTFLATSLGGAIGRSLVLYPVVLPAMTAFTWALVEPSERLP